MLQQINFNFDKLTSFKVLLTKFVAYCVACALRYCLSKNLNFFNFLICENSIFAFLIITFVTPCTLVFIYSCKTRTILGFSKNIILFLLFNSHQSKITLCLKHVYCNFKSVNHFLTDSTLFTKLFFSPSFTLFFPPVLSRLEKMNTK